MGNEMRAAGIRYDQVPASLRQGGNYLIGQTKKVSSISVD
jgi:hypothetical protein